jgi:hypothetical protein
VIRSEKEVATEINRLNLDLELKELSEESELRITARIKALRWVLYH